MIVEILFEMQILQLMKMEYLLLAMLDADNHLLFGRLQKVEVLLQPLIDISLEIHSYQVQLNQRPAS